LATAISTISAARLNRSFECLVPSRSPGLQFHGKLAGGRVEYQLGAFNGKGLLANNTTNTPEGVVRLRFSPWKGTDQFWLKGLSFGGALADGRTRNGRSVQGRTESRSFVFFEPVSVNGEILRTNGELTWLLGPAAIRAEYDQTNQARDNLGPGRTNLPGVVVKGYMVQGTYLLTGESKPETSLVKPKRSFLGEPGKAGFGAWELKFRYSNLQLSDSVLSNRAETFSTGVNWYLSPYVRHVLDLNVERFKDPLHSPKPLDRGAFFTGLSRVQFYF
jgi:phosphate-selective porin OprO/OprP